MRGANETWGLKYGEIAPALGVHRQTATPLKLPSLSEFFEQVLWLLWRQLNQRSQRKSYNWNGFKALIEDFLSNDHG